MGLRVKKRRFKQGNSPKGVVKVPYVDFQALSPLIARLHNYLQYFSGIRTYELSIKELIGEITELVYCGKLFC